LIPGISAKERALERIAPATFSSADLGPMMHPWPFSPRFNIPSSPRETMKCEDGALEPRQDFGIFFPAAGQFLNGTAA
jgi:hypothetical protein